MGDLARRLKLPRAPQELGLVCPNVFLAARHLEARYPGMSTFYLGEGSPTVFKTDGKSNPFTTRVGFGYYKGVILELAEPGVGSDVFQQPEAGPGEILVNHVGFLARGPGLVAGRGDKKRSFAAVMRGARIRKRYEAVINVVGFVGHVHIFDTAALTHGVHLEFIDFRVIGPEGPMVTYPVALADALAKLQVTVGPRFTRLPARHQLLDAPVPEHGLPPLEKV